MGERTSYPAGTFCWVDLATPDQDGAKAFYGGLLGWEFDDQPVGEGAVYSLATKDGKQVAAISPQPQQQRDAGAPAMWNSYVAVDDADAVAAKAGELGATVHAPPFDVMEVGRMAVIQDPQGAFFEIWQAKSHIGAQLVNAPGALCWNELASTDLKASAKFYGDLFGWEITPLEQMPDDYMVISNKGRSNGGIGVLRAEGQPPQWLVYFAVEGLDAATEEAKELGGSVGMGPVDMGAMRFAITLDPKGTPFALYEGQLED
jgi:predicted enzyme related to lactoylglutathione lyase